MRPIVSIAMPFYNSARTLRAALISIQRQSLSDWELLLCDDGSTDDGIEIARALDDPRFVIWTDGRRKGLAARLNECIARARGAYIARMDADDISYPQRLELQFKYLFDHPVDLAGTQMLIFGDEGQALGKRVLPCDHDAIVAQPALGFGLAHPTWMGRASWFRQYGYRAGALRHEDSDLLYRSYRRSCFANLPELLYGYRESRSAFLKRLKTRIGRVRSLCAPPTAGIAIRAAAAESLKTVSDAFVVAAGLRYQLLQTLEQALTPEERQCWQQVLHSVGTEGCSCR